MTPPQNDSDHSADLDDDGDEYMFIPRGPHFLTHVETFNAPLNVAVAHDDTATDANMQMKAINNLGNTRVSVDSRYAGTFDVNTMFAQADVLTWDGSSFDAHYDDDDSDSDDDDDGDDDSTKSSSSAPSTATNVARSYEDDLNMASKKGKVRMYLPAFAATTTTATAQPASTSAGRCLEYDKISSSQIQGWVGTPPRPPPPPHGFPGNQSHVMVVSSLSGAQLILQP